MSSIAHSKAKAKKVALTKLKTILAHPNKTLCPTIKDEELDKLRDILKNGITESGEEPLKFFKKLKINVGLESSLRALKNAQCSCVLLSQNIKPRYVLGLIARQAEVVDKNIAIYVHPEFEMFCESIGGISALSMTLAHPTDDTKEMPQLKQWLNDNKNVSKLEPISHTKVKKIKDEFKKNVIETATEDSEHPKLSNEVESPVMASVSTKSDVNFVPLNSNAALPTNESNLDDYTLENVLTTLVKKVKEVNECNTENFNKRKNVKLQKLDIGSNYQPLTLHKIFPNPNKLKLKRKKRVLKKQIKK